MESILWCFFALFFCNCSQSGPDIPEGDYIDRQAEFEKIPGWKFRCKVMAEEQTVEDYGGRIEFMKKMDKLLKEMDKYYCIPGINDQGGNELHFFMTEMETFKGLSRHVMYDDSGLEDESYDVRVVVNGNVQPGDISGGFLGPPYLAVGHDFEGLFEGWAVDALAHEFGHSRGMVDLYACEVKDPSKNPVTGETYTAPEGMMNYPYGHPDWTEYSLMTINRSAGDRVGVDHSEFLPYVYSCTVLKSDGTVAEGAKLKFYPVYPYQYEVIAIPLYEGVVGDEVYKFPQNPFVVPNQGRRDNNIFNFYVEIEYQGQKTYRWMPIFEAETDYGLRNSRIFKFYLDTVR